MTIDPKYKIDSIVWVMGCVPERVKILDIHELFGNIEYEVRPVDSLIRYVTLYKEERLFPTKEELIKSL